MRILNDEEMQLAINGAISNWALGGYKEGWGDNAMAQDNYGVIRNAQFQADIKAFAELLDNLPHNIAEMSLELYYLKKSLKQLVETELNSDSIAPPMKVAGIITDGTPPK